MQDPYEHRSGDRDCRSSIATGIDIAVRYAIFDDRVQPYDELSLPPNVISHNRGHELACLT